MEVCVETRGYQCKSVEIRRGNMCKPVEVDGSWWKLFEVSDTCGGLCKSNNARGSNGSH